MKRDWGKLPDFANPPVQEVAIAVSFDSLALFRNAHFGLFWSRIRDKYPCFEEHEPIKSAYENLEAIRPGGPDSSFRLDITLRKDPPVPRVWFLNESGNVLVQVQQNRFIHNWRRMDLEEPYPRYKVVFERFCQDISEFEKFIVSEGLGSVSINHCEVTYVNVIPSSDVWERHGQWDRMLTILRHEYSDNWLSEPEGFNLGIAYLIPDDLGNPLGRLHVKAEPINNAETGIPGCRLVLTARGLPEGDGLKGALKFIERGHEWIVRSFASLTTEQMHEEWGRNE